MKWLEYNECLKSHSKEKIMYGVEAQYHKKNTLLVSFLTLFIIILGFLPILVFCVGVVFCIFIFKLIKKSRNALIGITRNNLIIVKFKFNGDVIESCEIPISNIRFVYMEKNSFSGDLLVRLSYLEKNGLIKRFVLNIPKTSRNRELTEQKENFENIYNFFVEQEQKIIRGEY